MNPPPDKQRLQRIRWIGITLASYALDTLFLALFFLAGTLPLHVPLAYGMASLLVCGFSYLFFSFGWNRRFNEAGVSTCEICIALTLQCGVAWLAPRIAFPYLANMFTVIAFGVLQLSLRQFALVWAVATMGAGLTLFSRFGEVAVPAGSLMELALTWLFLSTVLGRCVFLSVVAQDWRHKIAVSKRKLAEALEQVRQLAIRDELTGAFNRRFVVERLQEEQARFERTRASYSLALFDLDHFKSINDRHGHGAGDAVLKTFVALVSETIRTTDVFGRYGGEEFLLILPATRHEQAVQALERIRARMREAPWQSIAAGLSVTFSAGVTTVREGCVTGALLQEADEALYEAKRSGRDRVVGRDIRQALQNTA